MQQRGSGQQPVGSHEIGCLCQILIAARKEKNEDNTVISFNMLPSKSSQHNKNFKDLYTKSKFYFTTYKYHKSAIIFYITENLQQHSLKCFAIPQRSEKCFHLLLASYTVTRAKLVTKLPSQLKVAIKHSPDLKKKEEEEEKILKFTQIQRAACQT